MYPSFTASILVFLGYRPEIDFDVMADQDGTTLNWYHADPKPTPEQVAAQELPWARASRIAVLERQCESYVDTLYSPRVVQDAALGIPSAAFRDQVIADRTQCSADLATAIAAVSAATSPADALAVTITWAVTR